MSDQKFCKYLIEKGILEDSVIYEALNLQRSKTRLFGQIALQERYITVKEVFKILDVQVDDRRPFGEIAIGPIGSS